MSIMQAAIAPAMRNRRPEDDDSDLKIQQAILMVGHAAESSAPQDQSMFIDPPDAPSSVEGKRSGKRELSTSKRAAQNRKAQRAFRQRKEGHIKKLEEQVRDYQTLSDSFKAVQAENYQLRDYIINLQSRLIESQGEFPPAPGNIDLRQPLGGVPAAPMIIPESHPPSGSVPVSTPGPRSGSASASAGSDSASSSSMTDIAVQPMPRTISTPTPSATRMNTNTAAPATELEVEIIQAGASKEKQPRKNQREIVDPSLNRA